MTDPIADYFTRLRNAIKARHRVVEIPFSKMKNEITRVLFEKGYILNYKTDTDKKPAIIKIAIKYNQNSRMSTITKIQKVSTPGLRQYSNVKNLPRVLNGIGIAILTTSAGIMTDKEARKQNIGGEVLGYVY